MYLSSFTFLINYTLRFGSTIPVFLATPDGESEAADGFRVTLVLPPVLLEPDGVRVLDVVEVLEVVVCVADTFCLRVGILLVE